MLHVQTNAVVQYTKIDINTTAQQTIAAAVAGNKVTLLSLVLSAAGAVTITLQSNNTALTGAMTLATGSPLGTSAEQYGLLSTANGEALKFTLGSGVQVSGVASWIYETV